MIEEITLPLLFELEDMRFYIYPVVLKNENELTLIDTGYPGFLEKIETAFEENGLDIHSLKQILITHHDHDHMGALNAVVTKYPSVKVKCSLEQMPYILGTKRSLRLPPRGEVVPDNGFYNMIKSVEHVDRVVIVEDGEMLCEGARVIKTPGHMPGHVSVYLEPLKTLISGDFLTVEDGELCIASKEFVLDKEIELESLRKIMDLDIEKVICYHGGEYTSDNIRADLERILEKGYEEE